MSTGVTNLSSKFGRVRRHIIKGNNDEAVTLLNELQAQVVIKIEGMKRSMEVGNRKCAPLENRIVDIEYVDSATSKLTINASTGRVSLKISDRASENVAEELKDFVSDNYQTVLPPLTFRGKIYWSKHEGRYVCVLQSSNKHHTHTIKSEIKEIV